MKIVQGCGVSEVSGFKLPSSPRGSVVMRMRVEIKAMLMEMMMMTIMKICADCGKGSTTLVTAFYHFYHLNVIMMSMMVTITNHCKFKSLNCLYFFKSCSPQIPEDYWVWANFFHIMTFCNRSGKSDVFKSVLPFCAACF